MAKRGVLYTTEELQYRKLAKQANQRAVRLERYLEKNPDAVRRGLDLYNYYLQQDFGSEKRRFQENPKKLSAEQISVYTVQLSNFLNFDVSRVKAVKAYDTAYRDYLERKQKEIKNYGKTKTPILTPQEYDANRLQHSKTIEKMVLGEGQRIASPSEFFDAINFMHKQGVEKVIGYRSAMRVIASLQNVPIKAIKKEISKIAGELAEKKKLGFSDIKARFDALQVQRA